MTSAVFELGAGEGKTTPLAERTRTLRMVAGRVQRQRSGGGACRRRKPRRQFWGIKIVAIGMKPILSSNGIEYARRSQKSKLDIFHYSLTRTNGFNDAGGLWVGNTDDASTGVREEISQRGWKVFVLKIFLSG